MNFKKKQNAFIFVLCLVFLETCYIAAVDPSFHNLFGQVVLQAILLVRIILEKYLS